MTCKSAWLALTRRSRLAGVGLYLAIVLLVAAGWLIGRPLHEQLGLSQDRLDTAAPPLSGERSVGQSFLGEYPGLAWIEVYLVRYDEDAHQGVDGALRLTLEREDGSGQPVVSSYAVAGLEHNQKLRFAFEPQADSQGTRYRMTLTSGADAGIAAWYTASEAYEGGHLYLDGEPTEGDLYFALGYRYPPAVVLQLLMREVRRWLPALVALVLVWGLPGWGLLGLLRTENQVDLWEGLALIGGLSACFWSLAFLWARVAGWALGPVGAALLLVGCVALGLWARIRHPGGWPACSTVPKGRWPDLVMAVVLFLIIASRLLQARDLVVPAWVDSPHHVLMTQLMLDQGMVPRSAAPYLPVGDLHYHFGFHASAAPLVWFSSLNAADAVLLAGQCWQMLAPLGAYVLAKRLLGDRWGAVIAAGLVGVWLYMPAYYTTWGRYPHLVGLTFFCLVAGAVPHLLRGSREGARSMPLVALLSAGLGLAHFRILVLYVIWWLVCLGAVAWEWRRDRRGVLAAARISGLAVATVVLLTLPWVVYVARRVLPSVESTFGGWAAQGDDYAFPWRYLTSEVTKALGVVAVGGAVWGLLRRRREVLWLLVWVGLAVLVSLPQLVGLTPTWLMSSSALAISFWVPVSVLAAYLVSDGASWAWGLLQRRWDAAPRRMVAPLVAATLTVVSGWGAWRMVDIVNPTTILADQRDMMAMAWIDEHTESGAVFLVNARYWQPGLYVGSDAGWWIPYLAHRQATQPPILYYHGSPAYRESIAELAEQQTRLREDPEAMTAWIRSLGVTHVYVGSRGGALEPRLLDALDSLEAVYSQGPVRVYQVDAGS